MKLPTFLDEYSLRARLFPALIAASSLICAFFVLAPWDKMGLPQLAASLASGLLLFVLSDLARRTGKRLEPKLYKRWGGKPTIVMLRHGDSAIHASTKAQYHKFLAGKVNATAPSDADEKAKLEECDAFYERCGDWLRENTRDTKKFKILFDENVTYGFRRNLLGLKHAALIIDALIVAPCAIAFWRGVPFDISDTMGARVMFIGAFAIVHAGCILLAQRSGACAKQPINMPANCSLAVRVWPSSDARRHNVLTFAHLPGALLTADPIEREAAS